MCGKLFTFSSSACVLYSLHKFSATQNLLLWKPLAPTAGSLISFIFTTLLIRVTALTLRINISKPKHSKLHDFKTKYRLGQVGEFTLHPCEY